MQAILMADMGIFNYYFRKESTYYERRGQTRTEEAAATGLKKEVKTKRLWSFMTDSLNELVDRGLDAVKLPV
jgi:hypothetical protein